MQNMNFWKEDEIEKIYDRFLETHKGPMTFVHWLFKEADTALAYGIGHLVQVMTDVHGEGVNWKYGVVTDYGYSGTGTQIRYHKLKVRFAGGCEYSYEIRRNPSGIGFNMNDTSVDLVRPAEISEDIIKLMLPGCEAGLLSESMRDKCPFRDEWKTPVPPCMKKGEKGNE